MDEKTGKINKERKGSKSSQHKVIYRLHMRAMSRLYKSPKLTCNDTTNVLTRTVRQTSKAQISLKIITCRDNPMQIQVHLKIKKACNKYRPGERSERARSGKIDCPKVGTMYGHPQKARIGGDRNERKLLSRNKRIIIKRLQRMKTHTEITLIILHREVRKSSKRLYLSLIHI